MRRLSLAFLALAASLPAAAASLLPEPPAPMATPVMPAPRETSSPPALSPFESGPAFAPPPFPAARRHAHRPR